jgi:hypothetical protein
VSEPSWSKLDLWYLELFLPYSTFTVTGHGLQIPQSKLARIPTPSSGSKSWGASQAWGSLQSLDGRNASANFKGQVWNVGSTITKLPYPLNAATFKQHYLLKLSKTDNVFWLN